MLNSISHITLLVDDQDIALDFYKKLGFSVHTDANFGDMRWLTLHAPNQKNVELALLQAEDEEEEALVGNQAASKPFITLDVSDCKAACKKWKSEGIEIFEEPKQEPWGISAAIVDPFGNLIYVCQPTQ